MVELSAEMQIIQAQFQAALEQQGGFFAPYTLHPIPGATFHGNVWAADPRGRAYAQAVTQLPSLAAQDVRFLTVRPGDEPPGEGATMPFDGGTLTLHFWAQVDPVSGEAVGACTWAL